jgi:TatD DNase family protein
MQLFDTHCHLDDEQFESRSADVVQRARDAGVVGIVTVGVTGASSDAAVRLAAEHDLVVAAVGIQPNYCGEASREDWDRIVALASQPGVVAIGETGLDRYWDFTPFPVQQDYFDRHLRLAQECELPFIVHMRDCEAEVLAALREASARGPLRGVMHSFTGTPQAATEFLELGLHISFAGMVTYKKSTDLRTIAAEVPADRLLVETDAPYLSPHPVRGQRPNEPALVGHTARCLAETRGVAPEELARQTTENARRLFALDQRPPPVDGHQPHR